MTRPIRRSTAPDPEKYAMSGSEDAEQVALFMWSASVFDDYPELRMMHHIPNGGHRSKSQAGRLKAMGVKAGVPDIFLPIRRGQFGGLYIELKRRKMGAKKKGNVSVEQNWWIAALREQGFGVKVCYGWEEARDLIVQYLEYDKPN